MIFPVIGFTASVLNELITPPTGPFEIHPVTPGISLTVFTQKLRAFCQEVVAGSVHGFYAEGRLEVAGNNQH